MNGNATPVSVLTPPDTIKHLHYTRVKDREPLLLICILAVYCCTVKVSVRIIKKEMHSQTQETHKSRKQISCFCLQELEIWLRQPFYSRLATLVGQARLLWEA